MSEKELQFTNWLGKASEYRGAQLERERIIKLLEDKDNENYYLWLSGEEDQTWQNYWEIAYGLRVAIELIKEGTMTKVTQELLTAIRTIIKTEPNPAIAQARILLLLKERS